MSETRKPKFTFAEWAILDPRKGGTCMNLLANKYCSYLCGYIQVIFWTWGIITLIFNPWDTKTVIEDQGVVALGIIVVFTFLSACMAVVLLFGLHRDSVNLVEIYGKYMPFFLLCLAVPIVVCVYKLIMEHSRFEFARFCSTVCIFLCHIFFFIVVRSFYLKTYCPLPEGERIALERQQEQYSGFCRVT